MLILSQYDSVIFHREHIALSKDELRDILVRAERGAEWGSKDYEADSTIQKEVWRKAIDSPTDLSSECVLLDEYSLFCMLNRAQQGKYYPIGEDGIYGEEYITCECPDTIADDVWNHSIRIVCKQDPMLWVEE